MGVALGCRVLVVSSVKESVPFWSHMGLSKRGGDCPPDVSMVIRALGQV